MRIYNKTSINFLKGVYIKINLNSESKLIDYIFYVFYFRKNIYS